MEESHHTARVKERGDILSMVVHIQELASPPEVFTVLLRRTVEEGGFSSGWVLVPGEKGWEFFDGYPPLEARKRPSFPKQIPYPWEGKSLVLKDGDHFLSLSPIKDRSEVYGLLVLKSSHEPEGQVLADLELLGTVAGGCIRRTRREVARMKALSAMVKAERLGRALLSMDDLEGIKDRLGRDVEELTGCKGFLILPDDGEGRGLEELEEGEPRAQAQRALERGRPVLWRDYGFFPLTYQGRSWGLLVLRGRLDKRGKGVLSLYSSSLAQALAKAYERSLIRERYRGMVVSPLLGLFQLDQRGVISFVNTTLALTLGYPVREARELVGRTFHDMLHPSCSPQIEGRLEAQLKGEGRPEIRQLTFKDKEGSPVPMMVSTVPITLPRGERGIMGVAIDITEKERLLEDLSQRNKELESFAYSAAHELKGPIVYLKRVVAQPSLEDFPMEELKWAVNRLESTLKHLTSYSLMDNKEVELERVSPYLLAEGIWKDIAKEVGITMDIAINLPPVIKSDPFLLDLIFRNLLRNAFKYGIKGDPPLVEVGYTRKKGEFLFYVRDHGEGFPPEKAEEIFKPFVRLHAGQKGTGLGLTIAKKAVEKLGGRIWAQGAPGKGATFYFTHPIL